MKSSVYWEEEDYKYLKHNKNKNILSDVLKSGKTFFFKVQFNSLLKKKKGLV